MSGGHFDYKQYRIEEIIDSVESSLTEDYGLSPDTIREFNHGIWFLKLAHTYAQRIDWLLSGDDDEEAFHHRLAEELDSLKQKHKII